MLQSMLPVGSVTEVDVPTLVPCLEGKVGPSSAVPLGPDLGVDPPVRGVSRVCFFCGHQGHGVNRCSQMGASFPFLSPGWSVDVRNGRYQVSRMRVDGWNYTPGKEGWSEREGQPPGSSEIVVRLTPEVEGGFWEDASWLGSSRWGVSADLTGPHINMFFRPWGATPQRMTDGVNVRFRMTLGMCREVKQPRCRSLLWGWAEVRWFHNDVQWVNLSGGCGLQERVGRRRRNL